MSRNLIYAIVAVAVLLIGYFLFFAGGAEEVVETTGTAADAVAGAASDAASTATEAASTATEAASTAADAVAGAASDAASTAADAASTAADAVAGAASDAASTAASAVSGAAASVTEMLSGAGLGDLSQSLSGLNLDGFDASLLDPANYSLDGLMTALRSAGLSQETATSLQNVLTSVAESPEMLAGVLNQIKTALGL